MVTITFVWGPLGLIFCLIIRVLSSGVFLARRPGRSFSAGVFPRRLLGCAKPHSCSVIRSSSVRGGDGCVSIPGVAVSTLRELFPSRQVVINGDKIPSRVCPNLLQSYCPLKAKTGNLKHLHARQIKHMIKPILLANGIRLPCESSHTKSGFPQHVARPSQNYELAITPLAQLQSPWPDNALMRLWVARSAWRSTLS